MALSTRSRQRQLRSSVGRGPPRIHTPTPRREDKNKKSPAAPRTARRRAKRALCLALNESSHSGPNLFLSSGEPTRIFALRLVGLVQYSEVMSLAVTCKRLRSALVTNHESPWREPLGCKLKRQLSLHLGWDANLKVLHLEDAELAGFRAKRDFLLWDVVQNSIDQLIEAQLPYRPQGKAGKTKLMLDPSQSLQDQVGEDEAAELTRLTTRSEARDSSQSYWEFGSSSDYQGPWITLPASPPIPHCCPCP